MSSKSNAHELIAAVEEGIQAMRQGRVLRTHQRATPPPLYSARQIVRIRKAKLGLSQTGFASVLGVSASTVRSWEQNQKKPSVLARRLIQLAERRPEVLRELTATGS
jgi:putative transcriptional regulator